jgi:hypothetical protein
MKRAALIFAGLCMILLPAAQQPPPGFEAEPGGTPEENLWQVLVLLGVGEREPAAWDGRASIASGEIFAINGYRFELPDRVLSDGGWRVRTKPERVRAGLAKPESMLLPKGVLLRGSGTSASRVTLATGRDECVFHPMALDMATPSRCAGGRIEVRRVPAATDLSGTELRQHDFPSLAAAPSGALSATWLSYHDRQEEMNLRIREDGHWTRLIPVARASADLWRPHTVTDNRGKTWLVWAWQRNSNWDIYAQPWEGNAWGEQARISNGALPDIEPHVARGGDGTVYVVWQAMEGGYSQIRLASMRDGKWSAPVAVTSGESNNWNPAVAAGQDGRAWIAWDRYSASYDIWTRSYTPGGGLDAERKVAATERFEAYASVTVDGRNRPWIAWEVGGVNWGKDTGPLGGRQTGTVLGDRRGIEVVCWDGGEWKAPAALRLDDPLHAGSSGEGRPLLFADPNGVLWMTFHRRYSRQARGPSTHWESFLTRLEGDRWMQPVLLPASAARQSSRMSITASRDRLWLFWPSESRVYDFMSRPRLHRVMSGSIALRGPVSEPVLRAWQPPRVEAPAGHTDETGDLATMRAYRARVGSENLRIVRGDLHRHTELSQDQGGYEDGSLPEFYRYMIDAAGMDFGASTDHQAGGTDYWNFLALKMADMYHFPERFVTLYGYERNLGFPHGHRNIIHTKRDYPIVPFFQRPDPKFLLPDMPDGELLTFNSNSYGGGIENDTKLLYEELRRSGGLAIPHTSGSSGMGTDWRDNDPALDPLVEIYQGDRHNYEHKNAPRGVRDGEESRAIGGFQEAGLVWNAWKKGYKLGVIASSDHFSTHISYAMIYTPRQDRQAIFDAMKQRHAYGATDNIVLEFRMGDHFMGDVFKASGRQRIQVKAVGTAPVRAVHVIRDAVYLYKVEPGAREVNFTFEDKEAGKGEHWYYVRLEQADGELAWSSPIWVTY